MQQQNSRVLLNSECRGEDESSGIPMYYPEYNIGKSVQTSRGETQTGKRVRHTEKEVVVPILYLYEKLMRYIRMVKNYKHSTAIQTATDKWCGFIHQLTNRQGVTSSTIRLYA